MSLWTPDGERPVEGGSAAGTGGASDDGAPRRPTPMAADLGPEQEVAAQRIAAEMQQVREQLAQVPAAVVIANHAMGCYELAAIHLSSDPPRLDEAQLAIDALGAILDTIKGRLGEDESTLQDALAQLRMAFVQVKAAQDDPGSAAGAAPADQAADS